MRAVAAITLAGSSSSATQPTHRHTVLAEHPNASGMPRPLLNFAL